jgi:hypothetical protein
MSDGDLVRLLLVVADSLERQNQAGSAGLLRRAARRIAADEASEGCERCGAPLQRRPTGRPRRFCSERCRRRKGAGKLKVVA